MFKEAFKKLKELFNDFGYGPYCPRPEVREMLEKKGYKFEHAFIALPHACDIYYVFTADGEPLNSDDGTRDAYLEDYEEAEQQYKAAQSARDKSNDKDSNGPKPPEPK